MKRKHVLALIEAAEQYLASHPCDRRNGAISGAVRCGWESDPSLAIDSARARLDKKAAKHDGE